MFLGNVVKVQPLAVAAGDNAFGAKHCAELAAVQLCKDSMQTLLREGSGGFDSPAGENLVGMVMMIVMIVTAGAVLTMLVMMLVVMVVAAAALMTMLVLVVMVVTAGALVIVMLVMVMTAMLGHMAVVVIMAALVAVVMTAALVLMMMIVITTALMTMLMIMMAAAALVIMIVFVVMTAAFVVMVVMMVVAAAGGADFLCHEIGGKGVALLHGSEKLGAGELIPGSSDDGSIHIIAAQKSHGSGKLVLSGLLGTAENDGSGMGDLILVELAEVLEINLALGGVRHGDGTDKLHFGDLSHHVLHGFHHVRKLAHTGGLDDDTVGMELSHDLLQRFAKVAHQRAADAAGVHLGNLDAGLFEETAVDTDLTEFIFNEDDLFASQRFIKKFFDEGSLPRAKEAGDDVYFCHADSSFFEIMISYAG